MITYLFPVVWLSACVCEGASEVESENAGSGASEGAKRAGEEEAVVPAETPSQTIERVEAFMRWLCQVRRVRSFGHFRGIAIRRWGRKIGHSGGFGSRRNDPRDGALP